MASGYFPISKSDAKHSELLAIANRINDIIDVALDDASDLDCSENALNDGSYITYLSLAKEFILRTLQ